MKHIFILFTVIIVILIIINGFSRDLLSYEAVDITVTVYYNDNKQEYILPAYSKLETILEYYKEETIDFEALNPQQILHNHDVINLKNKSSMPCVSINTGDIAQLITLKGIGQKTAERIVEHRNNHGLFQTIDQLMEVNGIGQAKFEKIEASICL